MAIPIMLTETPNDSPCSKSATVARNYLKFSLLTPITITAFLAIVPRIRPKYSMSISFVESLGLWQTLNHKT